MRRLDLLRVMIRVHVRVLLRKVLLLLLNRDVTLSILDGRNEFEFLEEEDPSPSRLQVVSVDVSNVSP